MSKEKKENKENFAKLNNVVEPYIKVYQKKIQKTLQTLRKRKKSNTEFERLIKITKNQFVKAEVILIGINIKSISVF